MSINPDFPLEPQQPADPMRQAIEAMTDCQERLFTQVRRMAVRAMASEDHRVRSEFASLATNLAELNDHFGSVMEGLGDIPV